MEEGKTTEGGGGEMKEDGEMEPEEGCRGSDGGSRNQNKVVTSSLPLTTRWDEQCKRLSNSSCT